VNRRAELPAVTWQVAPSGISVAAGHIVIFGPVGGGGGVVE
jgi:hypothetical protein